MSHISRIIHSSHNSQISGRCFINTISGTPVIIIDHEESSIQIEEAPLISRSGRFSQPRSVRLVTYRNTLARCIIEPHCVDPTISFQLTAPLILSHFYIRDRETTTSYIPLGRSGRTKKVTHRRNRNRSWTVTHVANKQCIARPVFRVVSP